MKLYELSKEYNRIIQTVDENGELTEQALEQLDKINMSIQDKAINISKLLTGFKGNIETIDFEIKRLTELKKTYKNNEKSLKEYLQFNLEKNGIEKIEGDLFKINFRKSTSVEIDDNILLPKEYIVEKTTFSADKTKIKKDLKEGKKIEGCSLKTTKHLQIK